MSETTHPDREQASTQRSPHRPTEWRALWELEDGKPAWLRDSKAAMDGAIQGEMGHS